MTTNRIAAAENELTGRGPDPELAVVGVGNRIMGDDGLGPEVIDRLEKRSAGSKADVRLINAGTTGFIALEAMSGARRAIVLDAIQNGEAPGTIQEYRCVDGAFETEIPEMTMHDVSFTEAMIAGREAYDLPDEIRILGVEPANLSIGIELSETVEQAATELVDMLTKTISDMTGSDREPDASGTKGDP